VCSEPCELSKGDVEMRRSWQPFGFILAVTLLALVALPVEAATTHPGGRYGTVGDMERTLQRNSNVLMAICNGFERPRGRGNPKLFWTYKHFRCWVVINSPYRQVCMTIHTLRNGRIVISRSVLARDALPGDCG
jgi:hypothetical protein